MSLLFSSSSYRSVTFRNNVFVSPMCQYSSVDGFPTDWHLVHLGSRAVGGAGLVITEATAINPQGRISPSDAGLWSKDQAGAYKKITTFIKEQGAVVGVQLAHAGRKASVSPPWEGGIALSPSQGGWQTIAPSALAFGALATPSQMSESQIEQTIDEFVNSTHLALEAGFQVVEVHAAHGYLLHEFLSPLSNKRTDQYGGSLQNRMRFPLEVIKAVRQAWPDELPVFVRISATDWVEGGWTITESVEFSKEAKKLGVDLIDCSSGGLVAHAEIPSFAGYQVEFAQKVKQGAAIATGAVGLITEAKQAEDILIQGQADAIILGREFLRDPYWPFHASQELDGKVQVNVPVQYMRAFNN